MSLHQRHIFYDMDMLDYFIKQIGQDRLQKFSEPYILGELRYITESGGWKKN